MQPATIQNIFLSHFVMAAACVMMLAAMSVERAEALEVVFDYRFDTHGMFDDPVKRQSLEAAASAYGRFTDSLLAIEPDASNTWAVSFTRPDGGGLAVVDDLIVSADSVTVFVGGWSFHPSVLGWAGQGKVGEVRGSDGWSTLIDARGQSGALELSPTDYGPWGGAITFNSNVNWHFDPLTDPAADQQDFLTTAMHELGHILGFGEAGSWFEQVIETPEGGYLLAGANTIALLGGPAALDDYSSHWASGTMSVVDGVAQETAMDPSTPRGERQWMTDLDYAGFADIGWQVPEPSIAMMLSVTATVCLSRRRRDCFTKANAESLYQEIDKLMLQ